MECILIKLLNVFETEEEAIEASNYDFLYKKELDRLNAINTNTYAKWQRHYAVCNEWDRPEQIASGHWVYSVCPESDQHYDTVAYSEDLFLKEEEDG